MKLMKSLSAYTLLFLLVLSVGSGVLTSCSGEKRTAETAGKPPETSPESTDEKNSIQKPERTLVFGEESEQAAKPEQPAEIVEGSAVLRRNAPFLAQAAGVQQYPFDLIIGKLSPYAASQPDLQQNDARRVRTLGQRFLEAALAGDTEQLQQMSSESGRDILSVQVGNWNTEGVRVLEIRIGEIRWKDAAAAFDFRIIASPGRSAGSAVCVYEDEQWRIQALEFDCSSLRTEYEPAEYSGFPKNYGYFQY